MACAAMALGTVALGTVARAEGLESPVADAALDCAVLTAALRGDPDIVRRALGDALRAEQGRTGAFTEDLMPRLQTEFAARIDRAASLSWEAAERERRAACPLGS